MSSKLALIVDDSRSARAVLARMLERHRLDVDTAESAEEAIEYLSRHRPDVIFMDHLMPGMDGLQAVQAIKNDPRTATIPIMMYTSQEGELYLGQARALGAVGVLPKQTRIADVSRALEQLHLIEPGTLPADTRSPVAAAAGGPDAAAGEAAGATAVPSASASAGLADLPPELRTLLESLLRENAVELRRFVVEHLDNHAERIVGDLRLLLDRGVAPAPRRRLPWLLALAAVLMAVAAGLFWWRSTAEQRVMQAELAAARAAAAAARDRAASAAPAAGAVSAPDAGLPPEPVLVDAVPFGEAPLAGARVEHVQALLERLAAQGFRGSVVIRAYPGRFCTSGSGDAVQLAAADTPAAKCDIVAATSDSASPAARESLAFANMLAAARRGGAIDVQLQSGGADEVRQPYPALADAPTAQAWNRVAALNNRVEVRLVPAAPAPGAAAPNP